MRKLWLAFFLPLICGPVLAQALNPRSAPIRADDCTAITIPAGQTRICIDNDDAKVYRCTSTGTCVEAVPTLAGYDIDGDGTPDDIDADNDGTVDAAAAATTATRSESLDMDGDGTPDLEEFGSGPLPNFGWRPESNTIEAGAEVEMNIMLAAYYPSFASTMTGTSSNAILRSIFGGYDNTMDDSLASGMYGAMHGTISNGSHSNIYGGSTNTISGGSYNAIFAGRENEITDGSGNAIAAGYLSMNSGSYNLTIGYEASGIQYGGYTQASGKIATVGDAQGTTQVVRRQSTDATLTSLLAGSSISQVPTDTSVHVHATCVGRQTGGTSKSGYYTLNVGFTNDAGTITRDFKSTTEHFEDDSGWNVSAVADSGNGGFKFQANGSAGDGTINWVCRLIIAKVTG